jgi:outer membrane biosynthesis protein TonB
MPNEHDYPPGGGVYEFHPLANAYPRIDDDALAALTADIDRHGLKQRILMFEGKVLDGRNRVVAWARSERGKKLNGVIPAPKIAEFGGTYEEAEQLVFSLNMMRRHLTTGQRALIAVARVTTKHGGVERFVQDRNSGLGEFTYADAAKTAMVSVDSIETAAAVRARADPEIFRKVWNGKMSLNAAFATLEPEEPEPETEETAQPEAEVEPEFVGAPDAEPEEQEEPPEPEAEVESEPEVDPEPADAKAPRAPPAKPMLGAAFVAADQLAKRFGMSIAGLIVYLIEHIKLTDVDALTSVREAIDARWREHERHDAQEPKLLVIDDDSADVEAAGQRRRALERQRSERFRNAAEDL